MPPLLSAEHHLVLDMKIIMKSMENLRVRREWQSILGNRSKFCFPASVEGSKLNFKIQKGRMLAGLIPVWDILHKKIEAEFEFELASFILKCSMNPEANHCRKGCKAKIKINWHIFKFLYFISIYSGCISSHKSFSWILNSKQSLNQDKHSFPSFLNRREERH